MSGIKALRKVALGREAAMGTAVAATTIWRGLGLMEDQRKIEFVEQQIGIVVPTTFGYVSQYGAAFTMDEVAASFQQLPHILEAALKTVTPAADGGGTDFIYTYPLSQAAVNVIKTYTIESGNNEQAEEMDYSFVESFVLSGEAGSGVMMSAEWLGRTVIDTTFTGGATVPSLVPTDIIVFGGSKFYIDAVGGTIGSTLISNTLLSFNLEVSTGWRPKWTNESLEFDFIYLDRDSIDITLDLVYEHNAAAETEKGIFQAGTPELFQLKFEGAAFGTPGTDYSNYSLLINMAGTYTEMPKGDNDGNDIIQASIRGGYDSTAAEALEIIVVNEDSVIP